MNDTCFFFAQYVETWPRPTPTCVYMWPWKLCRRTLSSPTPPTPPRPVCTCDPGKWPVCACDSSLCARMTLAGKSRSKLCLCALVTPKCVRGWPPDLPCDPLKVPCGCESSAFRSYKGCHRHSRTIAFQICTQKIGGYNSLPAPSKGCQLNPKGWWIDTP